MKFVKGISLFCIYPLIMFGLGMYTGVVGYGYFYPGDNIILKDSSPHVFTGPNADFLNKSTKQTEEQPQEEFEVIETIRDDGVLVPTTEYILQEIDMESGTIVEYSYKLPDKYLGMNRDSFLEAMDAYEQSPPLKEVERGFVGLEVLTFSSQKVVVQMSYAFLKPTENFYIGVEQNYVVVYLEDKETVYMQTDILLENLPEAVQNQIMLYMYVKGEEDLYHFLESYSS